MAHVVLVSGRLGDCAPMSKDDSPSHTARAALSSMMTYGSSPSPCSSTQCVPSYLIARLGYLRIMVSLSGLHPMQMLKFSPRLHSLSVSSRQARHRASLSTGTKVQCSRCTKFRSS